VLLLCAACKSASNPSANATSASATAPVASASAEPSVVGSTSASADPLAPAPIATRENVGPYEAVMLPERNVWYALPRAEGEHRLIATLHGQCGSPSYACGTWIDAGTERGFMVCPTGNEHCTSPIGPPMWDESFQLMERDLERGISVAQSRVRARDAGAFSRDDEVLVGYSRGGWAAIEIVSYHPGRWPYLILIEADVTIKKAYLDACKVRAVAMVAGEHGTELPGEQKSVDALKAAGFPAEIFVMPNTAHLYSANMDDVMRQALAFVLAH